MEIVRKFWVLILVSLILRLIIAAITFHSDVKQPALASAVVFQKGSFDFYGVSPKLSKDNTLDDLPLTYLINLPFHFLTRVFVNTNIENTFLNSHEILFGSSYLWVYLAQLKLPFIIADLILAVLLLKLTANIRVFIFWLFNPFSIWVTSAIGQFDIFPALFMVLSLVLVGKNRLGWAALVLGVGGAIKFFPFLFLPLLFGLNKHIWQNIRLILISLLPYALTVFPFLQSLQFRQNALLAPQLEKSLYAKLSLSGGEAIFIIPALLIFIYLLYFSKTRKGEDFLPFSTVIILMLLTFTHFHIQWFLWSMPFLILWFIKNINLGTRLSISGIFISLLVLLFLFEASLQIKLLSPVFPLLNGAIGLGENLRGDQLTFLRSITASVFAASSIYVSWQILRNRS